MVIKLTEHEVWRLLLLPLLLLPLPLPRRWLKSARGAGTNERRCVHGQKKRHAALDGLRSSKSTGASALDYM